MECMPTTRISARVSAIAESRDPGRRRESQGAEGGRTAGHRVRRRRAGLPDARLHRRGRAEGAPRNRRFHKYTPAGGLPELKPGDRRQDRPRLRLRRHRRPGARHQRRQAGRVPDVRHPARPRRRGAPARPVLDDLPGVDRAGRRRARPGAHRRDHRLPRDRRASSRPPAPSAPSCSSSSPRPTRPARSTRRRRSRRSATGPPTRASGSSPTRSTSTSSTATRSSPRSRCGRPEIADRCVVVNGVAKTYAMTGWRVGWMIGPKDVIKAATNLQSHATSNVANVSQVAALAAVSGDLSAVAAMREAFDRRRQTIVRMLNEIPGVDLPGARRARSTPTRASRASSARRSRGQRPQTSAGARRADPRRGRGRGRSRRGVRHARLLPAVLRAGRRRPGGRRRADRQAARRGPVAAR